MVIRKSSTGLMSNLCYVGLQSAFFWPRFKISSPTMGGTEHSSKTMGLSKKPSGYMEYKQKNFHNQGSNLTFLSTSKVLLVRFFVVVGGIPVLTNVC